MRKRYEISLLESIAKTTFLHPQNQPFEFILTKVFRVTPALMDEARHLADK
jgi:hypothetical protein